MSAPPQPTPSPTAASSAAATIPASTSSATTSSAPASSSASSSSSSSSSKDSKEAKDTKIVINENSPFTLEEMKAFKDDQMPPHFGEEDGKKCLDALKVSIKELSCDVVLNVVLLGLVGAGKSAFFELIDTSFCEKTGFGFISRSIQGPSRQGSCSKEMVKATFKAAGVRLVDFPGFVEGKTTEEVITNLLKGGYATYVVAGSKTSELQTPSPNAAAHAVIFVCKASDCDLDPKSPEIQNVMLMKKVVSSFNMNPILVVTHLDEVKGSSVKCNCAQMYSDVKVREVLEKSAAVFGFRSADVFPLRGNTSSRRRAPDPSMLALALDPLLEAKKRAFFHHYSKQFEEDTSLLSTCTCNSPSFTTSFSSSSSTTVSSGSSGSEGSS
eukprot:TRINITY_DN5038_c0_g1_i1.p1 TRINITY_DN5038_c0_g1~~TRINITY_DN5038_c0_g1_i1.p1  ORF type:complete len:391 (-),score=73.97 TRINITY_DN5038_c0_g1_i1:223-1371(-)